MRVSALSPVSLAIVAALKGDASLTALIGGRVYQGRGPVAAIAPYLVLNTPAENADNTFGRGGTINAEQVHVYAATDQMVRVLAGHIMRVLANDPLYIGGGFDIVSRDINLVTIVRDPDLPLSHGVLRFLPRLSQWQDWPGVWEPTADTVLFAEAFDQTPGVQTVRARIGPNGWLGDSPTTATNDPTLTLATPARWVMGQVQHRSVSFGDVLGDTIDAAEGFTMAVLCEVNSLSSLGKTIIRKMNPTLRGIHLSTLSSGMLRLECRYDDPGSQRDIITANVALTVPGRFVIGCHRDTSAPRAQSLVLWLDSVPITDVSAINQGSDPIPGVTPLDQPGQSFRFGGEHSAFSEPPESGAAIAVARGVMSASWHADFHAHAQARGWL